MYRLTVMIPEDLMKMAEDLRDSPPASIRKIGPVNTSSVIRLALQRGLDQLAAEARKEGIQST